MSLPERRYVARHRHVDELPAGPLRKWMIDQLKARGIWDEGRHRVVNSQGVDTTFLALSRSWGIPTRRAYEIIRGGEPLVPVDVVDRVFCSAGEPYLLNELYEKELDVLWPPNRGQGELDLWGDEARLSEQLEITA